MWDSGSEKVVAHTKRILALLVCWAGAVPLAAASQTVAGSFEELRVRGAFSEGETLLVAYVRDGGNEETVTRGSFVRLTPGAITVQPDSGAELEIAESEVLRIARERNDSVWGGAIAGGVAGAGFGALTTFWMCSSAWECETGPTVGYVLVVSGIGLAIGAGIDHASRHPREELVYLQPGGASRPVAVSLFPIWSKERKGVGIRLTW